MREPGGWRERLFPFVDLADYDRDALVHDLGASATVTFMGIPQGVAYAVIAGLPPAMGLYASCIPVIVGSLFRSSRHVITGPTNAVSLLVGTAIAAAAGTDVVGTALLLAFLVGGIQLAAGLLRLGVFVDFISTPVVIGYITGAGILIGIGQLPNLTETAGASGNAFQKIYAWAAHAADANYAAIGVAAATAVAIGGLRRVKRSLPGAVIVLSVMTLASWLFDFRALGLRRIADLARVPAGLPPLTLPGDAWSFDDAVTLLPIAVAITVLSLVESSALARAISARSGQRLELSTEFAGQGLANLAASFFGGYPCSGSLSRSAINHQGGAETRLAGVYSGIFMIVALLLIGPAVNFTPIAALAGLLLVVAVDLVDWRRIRRILRGRPSDAAAFLITVAGTWVLRLDYAIYVGVAVSLILYLRRSRILTVHHVVFDGEGRVFELSLDDPKGEELACSRIRIINVEGQLFFGAAGELTEALEAQINHKAIKAVVLRLRRARSMDVTTVAILEAAAARMAAEGRHLYLCGMRKKADDLLARTGAKERIGEEYIIPTKSTLTWFEAADVALARALEEIGEHDCDDDCPVARHLETHDFTPISLNGRAAEE